MSTHEIISTAMAEFIESVDGADVISSAAVARAAFTQFGGELIDGDPLQYAAFEHFKVMARKVVAGRFDPISGNDVDGPEQAEMFNGVLQKRYPVPASKVQSDSGSGTVYKRLDLMSAEEGAWISRRMRRASESWGRHADALDAYFAHKAVSA